VPVLSSYASEYADSPRISANADFFTTLKCLASDFDLILPVPMAYNHTVNDIHDATLLPGSQSGWGWTKAQCSAQLSLAYICTSVPHFSPTINSLLTRLQWNRQ